MCGGGGFGVGGAGVVSFGTSGTSTALVLDAEQSTLNSVDVFFTSPVVDDLFHPDALDASSWRIVYVQPILPGSALPLPQDVELLDEFSVRVYFDQPLSSRQWYSLEYLLETDPICGTPAFFVFKAFQTPQSITPGLPLARNGRFDFANPQYVADAAGNVVSLGTLQATDTGDIATETGVPYLRKRIVRRLTTMTGSFLHLPGYGLGIEPKRILRPSEQMRLKANAEAQIRQEPDVASVSVSLTSPAPGTVVFTVSVRTVLGQSDEFDATIGGSGA